MGPEKMKTVSILVFSLMPLIAVTNTVKMAKYEKVKNHVVCERGLSRRVVKMRPGVSYSYRSHAGKYYQPRTRCGVLFKVSSCSKMRFFCSQFNIPNKSRGCEG